VIGERATLWLCVCLSDTVSLAQTCHETMLKHPTSGCQKCDKRVVVAAAVVVSLTNAYALSKSGLDRWTIAVSSHKVMFTSIENIPPLLLTSCQSVPRSNGFATSLSNTIR